MIGRRQPGNSFHLLKTRDCEPRGQAVLLGSLTLLFSAQVPLLNKVSCLVSLCVSSENSFLSVRQEPWKGSPFLQQFFSNLLKTKDTTFKKAKIAFFKKKLIFIFGFSGSLLLCAGFLQLQQVQATLQLWHMGFSLWWLLMLRSVDSRCIGFSNCDLWALELGLSSCGTQAQLPPGMWNLPGLEIKPVPSALAGGFSNTGPPRKS